MALTWDQVAGITGKYFVPKLVDNIFDSNVILMKLKEKANMVSGGNSLMVPLNYAQTTANGWFSGADTLDTSDNENITSAEYSWKQAYANITLTRLDVLKNSGDEQKVNLAKAKVEIAEKTLKDTMGTGIFNDGTTAKAFVGLRAIVDTSSSVGGISQTTYSWWAAQLDSSSTVLTIPTLNTQFSAASIDNDTPTLGVAGRTVYNLYYAALQPQQRFADSGMAKGGFSSLLFNGKPIVIDSHCPASTLFFLNLNYLHLFIHKDENFRFEPFVVPKDQNVKSGKIYFAGALGSSNNRMHARLSALAS